MFRVEHLYKHVQESVKVEWNLGKRCNYDCSYCPAEIHDNTSKHTDIKLLKSAVDSLVSSCYLPYIYLACLQLKAIGFVIHILDVVKLGSIRYSLHLTFDIHNFDLSNCPH